MLEASSDPTLVRRKERRSCQRAGLSQYASEPGQFCEHLAPRKLHDRRSIGLGGRARERNPVKPLRAETFTGSEIDKQCPILVEVQHVVEISLEMDALDVRQITDEDRILESIAEGLRDLGRPP